MVTFVNVFRPSSNPSQKKTWATSAEKAGSVLWDPSWRGKTRAPTSALLRRGYLPATHNETSKIILAWWLLWRACRRISNTLVSCIRTYFQTKAAQAFEIAQKGKTSLARWLHTSLGCVLAFDSRRRDPQILIGRGQAWHLYLGWRKFDPGSLGTLPSIYEGWPDGLPCHVMLYWASTPSKN